MTDMLMNAVVHLSDGAVRGTVQAALGLPRPGRAAPVIRVELPTAERRLGTPRSQRPAAQCRTQRWHQTTLII
jgi:hypothetical protein